MSSLQLPATVRRVLAVMYELQVNGRPLAYDGYRGSAVVRFDPVPEPLMYAELTTAEDGMTRADVARGLAQLKLDELIEAHPRLTKLQGSFYGLSDGRRIRIDRGTAGTGYRISVEHPEGTEPRTETPHIQWTNKGPLRIDGWTVTRTGAEALRTPADGTEPALTVPADGTPDSAEWTKEPPKRVLTVWRQREHAQKQGHRVDSQEPIEDGQRGDADAHAWLLLYADDHGDKPVKCESWRRYLSDARRAHDGPNPRQGRPHGSSIVSAQQV